MSLFVHELVEGIVTASNRNVTSASDRTRLSMATPTCQCEIQNPAWVRTTRTIPKCVFIDLGAANGNSFYSFVTNDYGPVANCPSGQWEATLVEANPRFDQDLNRIASAYPGQVHPRPSTAAYMCEGQTSFYLDTVNHANNYWGSSMSPSHPAAVKSGHHRVTVPTLNLNRLLYEHTLPNDYVMVKMDIEGTEWDILPCLAQAQAASLIDVLYMEVHPNARGDLGTSQYQLDTAKAQLRQKGVNIPPYFSHTLINSTIAADKP